MIAITASLTALSLLVVLLTANRPSLLAPTSHVGYFPRWMAGPLGVEAFHCRGLEEKIWNVFAPSSTAFNAARSSDPAMEV